MLGAIAKGRRGLMKEEEVAALRSSTLWYPEEELDQGALSVWKPVLHAAACMQALGRQCQLIFYAQLKALGKTASSKNRATP